jgi:hypothetical protein
MYKLRFRGFKERTLAAAALACERLLTEESRRLASLARSEGATPDMLQAEIAAFEASYASAPAAAGPTKWARFAEFMRDVYGGALRDLAARQAERQRAQASAAEAEAQQARSAAQAADARVAAAEALSASLRTRVGELEAALASEQQAAARATAAATALEARMRDAEADLRREVESLRAHLEAESAAVARHIEGAKTVAASEARVRELTGDCERLNAALEMAVTERAEAQFALENAHRRMAQQEALMRVSACAHGHGVGEGCRY